jgi:putative lipoprotein (rSAM/lipoprotein system)
MAPIKFKFLKSYNSLIAFLLTLLGFSSSCDPARVEYGTPSADFILKGKIVSAANNNPIQDIIIEMRRVEKTQDGQTFVKVTDTSFSEYVGNFILTDNGAFPKDQTYQIKFTDTDGLQNGEYEPLDTTIVFQNPTFINGDGHWYNGQTEKELNVKLKPKK